MRTYCITKKAIKSQYYSKDKSFWDKCRNGFEKMFSSSFQENHRNMPHISQTTEIGNNSEIFSPVYPAKGIDWSWCAISKNANSFFDDICSWLKNINHIKLMPILQLSGNAGSGKTTFIRYFFSNYIRKDTAIADKTYVLRLSMSSIRYVEDEFTREKLEEYFDSNVYRFLLKVFNKGEYNITNPDVLVNIALAEYNDDSPGSIDYFKNNKPSINPPDQLKWINEIVMGKAARNTGDIESYTSDFNRLIINYLGSTDRDLRIVFVLDDVDQLKIQTQRMIWQMVRHKLTMYERIFNYCFIIPISYHFLQCTSKEDSFRSVKDRIKEIEICSPSLFEILKQRKLKFFDPVFPHKEDVPVNENEYDNLPSCVSKGRRCNICRYPKSILSRLLYALNENETYEYISQLANYDIRQGLEIVKFLLQYPFCDWVCLGNIIRTEVVSDKSYINTIINRERILDAIMRNSNYICEAGNPFFDNIYNVDNITDHYSNSLSKLFILKILKKSAYSKKQIYEILEKLGHHKFIIKNALDSLLDEDIITSSHHAGPDDPEMEVYMLTENNLYLQYLDEVGGSVFYLQAMAYLTPLNRKYCDKVPIPSVDENDVSIFIKKMDAAKVLVEQIAEDLDEQMNYIAMIEVQKDRKECEYYVSAFELSDVLERIRHKSKSDIERFFNTKYFKNMTKEDLLALLAVRYD